MCTEYIYSDLRVLTLKRLVADFDLEMLSEESYVSLSNYHFIDIWPVKLGKSSLPISAFYEQREERGKSLINEKVHVIQNILLFGNHPGFWEQTERRATEILYITMVHFSDEVEFSARVFEDAVRAACQNPNHAGKVSEEDWCIYYALDFCDAVMFTRGCSFDRYQEILWDLTVRGKSEDRIAVDTISLYAVSSKKVKTEFSNFNQGRVPVYPSPYRKHSSSSGDNFDLAIFLSVQNENKWLGLQQALLQRYGGSCQDGKSPLERRQTAFCFYRKFGRTDITANLLSLDLENALYVVWLVIENGLSLDSCTLAPLSPLPSSQIALNVVPSKEHPLATADDISTPALLSTSLGLQDTPAVNFTDVPSLDLVEKRISEQYNRVSQRLEQLYKPLHGYLTEIYLSLQALLKNSFAEEYYLSVLPSFAAHLDLIDERLTLIENERNSHREWMMLADQLVEDDLREYYRCLMLLEHATVHGEKKYIQTPGLNAFICEVPAKLLVFYTAVAWRIISRLRDENAGMSYVPVLIPDFRQDMYSHSLSNYPSGDKTQVGIIFLEERLFYEPEYTIPSMIHEIAHKVGDKARHRLDRLYGIFKCLSFYLISSVLSEEVLYEAQDAIDNMAEIFTGFFYDSFCEEYKEEAYQSNINEFLKNTEDCIALLEDKHGVLVSRLSKSIESKKYNKPLLHEKGWPAEKSVFWEGNELSVIAWETFFSTLLKEIWSPFPFEEIREALEDYCVSLMSVFSEGYSDLRMLELVGCDERGDRYRWLLRQMISRKDFFDREDTTAEDPRIYWRYAAVCDALNFPHEDYSGVEVKASGSRDAFIIRRTREELAAYLSVCHKDSLEKDETIAEYVETGCADIFKLRKEITDYRMNLLNSFANDKQAKSTT